MCPLNRGKGTLTHYDAIKGLTHIHIVIKDISTPFQIEDIRNPTMPDGTELNAYCLDLLCKLGDFIEESLALLPDVKREMIARNKFSAI